MMTTKFNVGDKVRMLDKDNVEAAIGTKNGDEYVVTSVYSDGDICIDDKSGGVNLIIFKREFTAIELVTTQYKTEKRKANVGERILVTNSMTTGDYYEDGDVLTVKVVQSNTVITFNNPRWVRHSEYEVIVETPPTPPKPKKSARITALESQVAVQHAELKALTAKVEALESAQPKPDSFPLTAKFEREDVKPTHQTVLDAIIGTPNQQRADVIKRAHAFVEREAIGYKERGIVSLKFVVNPEKRTVVAMFRGLSTGVLHAKAVAKCDPDDVFNTDIGKAIALARALGVEVPVEFVKAVQPTEIVVGHRIYYTTLYPNILVIEESSEPTPSEIGVKLARMFTRSNRILDDSNAEYS